MLYQYVSTQQEKSEVLRLLLQYTEMQKAYESDSSSDSTFLLCGTDSSFIIERQQGSNLFAHPKASIQKKSHIFTEGQKKKESGKITYANVIRSATRFSSSDRKNETNGKTEKETKESGNIRLEIPNKGSQLFDDPFHDDWAFWH